MATNIMQGSSTLGLVTERGRLTRFQRHILRRAHPTSMFIEAIGLVWGAFFLWNRLVVEAIVSIVFARMIANVVAYRANTDAMANTGLGRMALLHLHPVNMTLHVVGVVGVIYGIWAHETRFILGGLSVVLLGHLAGWVRVDRRFELQ